MFKELMKLVNNLDIKDKSGLEAELKRLESLNLITMPKSLDEMLKDEKFADFKKEFDSKIGSTRTKWENELKEKEEKEKLEKLETPKPNEDKGLSEIEKAMLEYMKKTDEKLSSITGQKNISDLTAYASEKIKDLPEPLQKLLKVSETSTQEEIDNQINLLTETHKDYLKTVDNSPAHGIGNDGVSTGWKEFIEDKNEE